MKTEPIFKPPGRHVAWVNSFEKQMGRAPTDDEIRALQFIQHNHRRDWRKRYSRSLADFMLARPAGMASEVWRSWYFTPYGIAEWNQHITIVRRLLAGETP